MPLLRLEDGTSKGSTMLECRGCNSTLKLEITAERTNVSMTAFRSALEDAAARLGWKGDHCARCATEGPDRG